jgi:NitT/TauT family transport system substrate-binding protein
VPWWLRADYLTSNPDDAAAFIGEYLIAPADDVKGVLAGDTIYGLADNKRLFGNEDAPGPVYQSMQSVVNFGVESKLIDNAPSVDSPLAPQLIRDAR